MFKTIEIQELHAVTGGNMFSRIFAAGAVDAITGRGANGELPKLPRAAAGSSRPRVRR